jgi:diacylglycerol kinase (ATP)
MKTLFIVNPIAGKGRAKTIVPLIEDICGKSKIEYTIKYTMGPKHEVALAKLGIQEGFERIVSVGGDGTLNEVVNGIAGSQAVLGVIPAGTGNDFVRTVYPHTDIKKIIHDIIHGEVQEIDLAKCNDTYFINIGSGGFDAQVALESEKTKKIFSSEIAYIIAILKTLIFYKGIRMKVLIDGKVFEKNTMLVAVANGKYYGGGILPAPKADITDGIFDVCFVENMSRIKMLVLLPKYMKGKHESIKGVSFYRGKNISITSEIQFGVNIDGEVSLMKEVNFSIIPKGIKIIADIPE